MSYLITTGVGGIQVEARRTAHTLAEARSIAAGAVDGSLDGSRRSFDPRDQLAALRIPATGGTIQSHDLTIKVAPA